MHYSRPSPSDLVLAACYFGAAAIALSLTRFDGGVAFLWLSSSLVIPVLARRRRRDWGNLILLCGAAGSAATGLFGLGWSFALPFAVINMTEAYLGASYLMRRRSLDRPLGSLGWIANFIAGAGIVAPVIAGLFAASIMAAAGRPFVQTFFIFWAGHALGNITFIPLVALLTSGEFARSVRSLRGARLWELLLVLTTVAAVTVATFSTSDLPLLFLPCGPIVLAIFRARQIGAATSIALLALIGGGFTIAGHGPIQMIDASFGVRIQFFQFYLAAVVLTVLPVAADLKNRSRLHRELRFSEERYRMLADHSSDILMQGDLEGRVLYVSPSVRLIGGYDPDELIGRLPARLILPEDHQLVLAEHLATLAEPGSTRSFEYRGVTNDGQQRWFETHCKAILDGDGKVEGILSVIRDVTVRKAAEASLKAAAMTDALTGLPNRRAFQIAADNLMADRRGDQLGCVAIVDLDHFKRVNDLHGHDGGDAVLCQFAEQAREAIRDVDMVARLGGEEFALLLPGATLLDAITICERLRLAIAGMGVPVATGMIRVTMSGGVAELGEEGLETAIKRADEALYQAKASGRDQLALAA